MRICRVIFIIKEDTKLTQWPSNSASYAKSASLLCSVKNTPTIANTIHVEIIEKILGSKSFN